MFSFNPYERAPSSFPVEAKVVWTRVYETCLQQYTTIPGYEDYDARLSATVVTKTLYSRSGGRWRPAELPGIRRMPDAGNVAELGTFLGVDVVDRQGNVYTHTFSQSDRVAILWSQDLRAVIAVPKLRVGACTLQPTAREDKILRKWARGRKARCSAPVQTGKPPLPRCYAGMCVSYVSDKFSHGEPKTYVHHFDSPGVKIWLGNLRAGVPSAFFVQGGKLRIEEHGIAG